MLRSTATWFPTRRLQVPLRCKLCRESRKSLANKPTDNSTPPGMPIYSCRTFYHSLPQQTTKVMNATIACSLAKPSNLWSTHLNTHNDPSPFCSEQSSQPKSSSSPARSLKSDESEVTSSGNGTSVTKLSRHDTVSEHSVNSVFSDASSATSSAVLGATEVSEMDDVTFENT